MMHKKLNDSDQENELKEVFRVFGKDETGTKIFCSKQTSLIILIFTFFQIRLHYC